MAKVDVNGNLDIELLPSQMEMRSFTTEWAAARGGKGSGKTVGLCYWMLERLEMYPEAAHFVVGADFEQLRRGFFPSFIDVLTDIHWEAGVDFRYRESPSPMIILKSGARLRALGAIQAVRIESVEFQTLLLEEPQTWKNGEDVFGILNTRLRHSIRSAKEYGLDLLLQGRMSFNPPAVGSWLYEIIEKRWPAKGYACQRVSVRDNYLLLDREGYVRRLETALPPNRWPSQIDGHWSTTGGGVFREFQRDIHGNPPAGIPRGIERTKPLLWSLDFNVGHMRSVIAQVYTQRVFADGFDIRPDRGPIQKYRFDSPGWTRRILRFIGEIAIDDTGTQQVVAAFAERFGDVAKRTGVVLYGDSTGGSRSQIDGLTSNWSTIIDGLTCAGIPFSYDVIRNGAPLNRIVKMDATFRSGAGLGCTVDIDACPELLFDIENVQWNKQGTDFDKSANPRLTHAADAAGYLCVGFAAASLAADYRNRTKGKEPILSR